MSSAMFLLDTNACIRILNNTSASLVAELHRHSPEEICLCAVTKAELLYGAQRSARPAQNLRLLEEFWAPYASAPFDDKCAYHYGEIRAHLERQGTPIGPNDLLIAATTVANDLTLVTHNVREFARVIGLRLEDWEAQDRGQLLHESAAEYAADVVDERGQPQFEERDSLLR
jgi:tRNA(fMet)-specific endonuclease VapC